MAARSIGSGTLRIDHVVVPFRMFTAQSEDRIGFTQLHTCGSRLEQQLVCKAEKVVVPRDEVVRGYEVSPDIWIRFSAEELKRIDLPGDELLVDHFIAATALEPRFVAKTTYLGPDKGGARAFALISETLERAGSVAIGTFAARGRDSVVAVGSLDGGLALYQLHFAREVRPYDREAFGASSEFDFEPLERRLAEQLVACRTSVHGLDLGQFPDRYSERVRAAIDAKVAGDEIVIAPVKEPTPPTDLLDALRASVARSRPARGPKTAKARGRGARAAVTHR